MNKYKYRANLKAIFPYLGDKSIKGIQRINRRRSRKNQYH